MVGVLQVLSKVGYVSSFLHYSGFVSFFLFFFEDFTILLHFCIEYKTDTVLTSVLFFNFNSVQTESLVSSRPPSNVRPRGLL